MAVLNRAAFEARTKRRYREVSLGGGDTVRIQSLNEIEHSRWEAARYKRVKSGDRTTIELAEDALATQAARLLQLCVVDETGERVFQTWEEAGQIDAELSSTIYAACREHCGLDREDPEKNLQ